MVKSMVGIPSLSDNPDIQARQLENRRRWIQNRRREIMARDPVTGRSIADRIYCVGQSSWLDWMALKPEERQRIADAA